MLFENEITKGSFWVFTVFIVIKFRIVIDLNIQGLWGEKKGKESRYVIIVIGKRFICRFWNQIRWVSWDHSTIQGDHYRWI